MTLKGKRVAILAENMYQEMELWVPSGARELKGIMPGR
jgi:hypothetical protein